MTLSSGELILRLNGKFLSYSERNGGAYQSYLDFTHDQWFLAATPNITQMVHKTEFAFEFISNSEGIRDVEHRVSPTDDVKRILVLGDSFVESAGCAFQDAWFKVLERRLKAQGAEAELISGGVGGNDVLYALELYRQRLSKYKPEIVLVLLNNTDVIDMACRGGKERFKPDGSTAYRGAPWFEPYYRRSHVVRFMAHMCFNRDATLLDRGAGAAREKESKRIILEVFEELADYAVSQSADILFIIHPIPAELRDGFETYQKPFFDELNRRELPHVNLYPTFQARLGPHNIDDYSWPIDAHFNAKGYALMAELIEDALTGSGLPFFHPDSGTRSQGPR
ncbi:MAG: hypothetical protein AAF492_09740 [Verrucomicrobiota bacterium]